MVVLEPSLDRLHRLPCFRRPHLDRETARPTASDARPHAYDGGERYPVEDFSKVVKPVPLPPLSSAHPPSCFRGLIFGELGRYWRQNSHPSDYVELANLFFMRLKERGHRSTDLVALFREAAIHLTVRNSAGNNSSPAGKTSWNSRNGNTTGNSLFIHINYHSRGIQRKEIRSLYDRFLRGNVPASFEKMIVALSRPSNLRDVCVSNKFERETPTDLVSKVLAASESD